MTMRIWHQSITDLSQLPGYAAMLADHARTVCGPDTKVDVHGVKPGTYPHGMAPVEMVRYRWAHELVFLQIVENIVRAEREGYDAVAISCFVDPGLEEARSLVDIPVVSSCEAALLISSTVGRAFGLLTLDDSMVVTLRGLVRRYGFDNRVVSVVAFDPPLTEYELDRAFAGSPDFVERFVAQAQRVVDAGADVVIPAEGVLNTVLVRNGVRQVRECPVLDSYGALLALAQALVQLRRRSGLLVGRRGAYARPPRELVQHLRGTARDILHEAQLSAER